MASHLPRSSCLVAMALAATARAGTLQVTPASHDFGGVAVAAPAASVQVTITNSGSNTTITGFTKAGSGCAEFTATSGLTLPVTLANGQELTVTLSYDPANRAADACNITIEDDNGINDVIQVQGDGLAPMLAIGTTTLNFADQPWNGSTHETKQVLVENVGDQPFSASNLGLALTSGTHFSVGTVQGTFPVEPSESILVPVTFDPASIGAKTDMLTVSLNNDSPGDGNRTVNLSGNGTESVGVGDDGPMRPGGVALRPTPSRGTLTIEYTTATPGSIALEVLDLSGRVVARVLRGTTTAGSSTLTCRDGQDWSPATGLYLVRVLHAGRVLGTARAVVIR